MTPVDINVQWREVWTSAPVVIQSLVADPTIRQPGFDLPRHTRSMLNRCRTGRSSCRADLHQWGLSTSESCSCGQKQTMSHIVDSTRVHYHGLKAVYNNSTQLTIAQFTGWRRRRKKALAKWKILSLHARLKPSLSTNPIQAGLLFLLLGWLHKLIQLPFLRFRYRFVLLCYFWYFLVATRLWLIWRYTDS